MNSEIRGEVVVMQDDYSDVLERVFNKVKDRKEGVLFTCIGTMAPKDASEIISHFSINPSASFYDDLQVIESPSFQPVLTGIDPMNIRNMSLIGLVKKSITWNSSLSVGLIIVLALVIVGLWNLPRRDEMGLFKKRSPQPKKPVNRRLGAQQASNPEETNPVDSQYEDRQADLCLVVPCRRIETSLQKQLRPGKLLLRNAAVTLVEDSVYFLATESAKNGISEINLSDDWKDFPEGSDLLVQLHVSDGNDLIGVDLKRSLSRAISNKEEITIEKIGLLNDLNNLEKFHRA